MIDQLRTAAALLVTGTLLFVTVSASAAGNELYQGTDQSLTAPLAKTIESRTNVRVGPFTTQFKTSTSDPTTPQFDISSWDRLNSRLLVTTQISEGATFSALSSGQTGIGDHFNWYDTTSPWSSDCVHRNTNTLVCEIHPRNTTIAALSSFTYDTQITVEPEFTGRIDITVGIEQLGQVLQPTGTGDYVHEPYWYDWFSPLTATTSLFVGVDTVDVPLFSGFLPGR